MKMTWLNLLIDLVETIISVICTACYDIPATPLGDAFDNMLAQAYLAQTLVDDGDTEYDRCLAQWVNHFGHDTASACGRLVLGYQRLWPGKVRIYRKAHGWTRDSFLTSNFWCESDFLLHDWPEKSIEGDLWMSPHGDEDSASCALKGTAWKWLPNKQINCTVIRDDFQAFETTHRRNYPKVAEDFLKQLEVWSCFPQCEVD
ncbi:hypothetical protein COOONC_18590 [Cooperia oncophora]